MGILKVLLVVSLAALSGAQDDCPADGCVSDDIAHLDTTTKVAASHYYIGGLFGVHEMGPDAYTCGKIRLRGLLNLEAFFWAIKKYSVRAGLTTSVNPVSVGGFAMDSCTRVARTIENVYSFETCRTQYAGISPRNTVAFVGPDTSGEADATAKLLNDMGVTLVSHFASSPALSNNETYKFFLRTIPPDSVQTKVITKMMKYKSIKYVLVLYKDDAYGIGLFNAFKHSVDETDGDVCIVRYMKFGMADAVGIRAFLAMNRVTKYVVVLGSNNDAHFVLQTVDGDVNLKNRFTFIGTSSWGRSADVIRNIDSAQNAITITADPPSINSLDGDIRQLALDVNEFYDSLNLLEPDTGKNFLSTSVNKENKWFTEFWEEAFGCSFDADTCNLANQRIEDKIDRSEPGIPYTLQAVNAIIRGIKAAAIDKCNSTHVCTRLLNPEISRQSNLYNFIKNSTMSSGRRYFAPNGDPAAEFGNFKIYQISNGTYHNVLDYDASKMANYGFIPDGKPSMVIEPSSCPDNPCLQCGEQPTTTKEPETQPTTVTPKATLPPLSASALRDKMIELFFKKNQEFTGIWRDYQMRADEDSKTRFEKGHDWILAIGVCGGLGIVCVFVFEIYILYKLMGTKIGKQWRTMWLGQLLLFGIFCSYLVLFAYLPTPTKATCGIIRFGVGVSYAMCFAVLLVKLMVLLTSKTTADTLLPGDVDSPNYLRGIYQFLMYIFVVGVQLVIAAQWLITVPPEAVQVTANNGDLVWICNHYTWSLNDGWGNTTTFVRTNFENHLISLSYVMFLILLTTIIAMKAHGIITNHRESVFIGIAAGFTIPVFVAWGLVGGLNKDHQYAQEFGDASMAFGLFITATIVLFAMFLPKVRQLVNMGVEGIYLEDDRDTYYAGSVVMAPPSYKSRPSSVVYVNSNGYNDPVIIGDQNAVHLKHPGSNYSAPVYIKRPESVHGSGKVLRVTGDLTGKHPRDNRKSASEAGYVYAGSGYGGFKKPRSESGGGGTLRRAASAADLGAL